MKTVVRIFWIIIGLACIVLGILCIVRNHNICMAEMGAQIAQNGFYKKDIWISITRYQDSLVYGISGVVLIIGGVVTSIITCAEWVINGDYF